MAKKNEIITITREELNNVIAQAVAQALAQGKTSKKATGKAQPKAEKVEFINAKGEKKLVSKAQADAWRNYAERGSDKPKRTKEELAEMSAGFKFTKAMDAFIKANPVCTQKQFQEKFGCKGMTKKQLRERKAELKLH